MLFTIQVAGDCPTLLRHRRIIAAVDGVQVPVGALGLAPWLAVTPAEQRISGVDPCLRRGRNSDGRRPVARPSASIAKCCGCSVRARATKRGTSSTVREFGSSSVYVCHAEVSSGRMPFVGL